MIRYFYPKYFKGVKKCFRKYSTILSSLKEDSWNLHPKKASSIRDTNFQLPIKTLDTNLSYLLACWVPPNSISGSRSWGVPRKFPPLPKFNSEFTPEKLPKFETQIGRDRLPIIFFRVFFNGLHPGLNLIHPGLNLIHPIHPLLSAF